MKNLKTMSFFLLLSLGLLSACKKDTQTFTIESISPADGTTVANKSNVHIEVIFNASEELEELELNLTVDSVGAASISPFPIHSHDHVASKTLMQDIDLSSYPSGTAFRLTASSCKNHDCTEKVTANTRFLIP